LDPKAIYGYAISPRRISSDRAWSLGLSGWNLDWKFVSTELYRFAMREGHEIEDFSAIYDYLTTTQQTPPASAKA